MTVVTIMVTGMLALSAGCAARPASAPSASATPPPVPGQLSVTGAVRQPLRLSTAQLAALPGQTVSVSFGTERGTERHVETGSPLITLIDRAGLALTPGVKHDELSVGILVVGSDGYRALLSYGELAPDLGDRQVLLATSQDGTPLAAPRLVVVGDVKGARDVSGVVRIEVQHPR